MVITSGTTIEVKKGTLFKLGKLRDPVRDKSWSEVIDRLIDGQAEIYVDVLTVDGILAKSSAHDIIFQLGDSPPRYYRYRRGKFEEIPKLPEMKVEVPP